MKVCDLLKAEFCQPIVHEKRVVELADLKQRYLDTTSEKKIKVNSNVSASFFKGVLKKAWPQLRFVQRKGLNDLVCTDQLSIEEAVRRTASIEAELKYSYEYVNDASSDDESLVFSDETSIVHKAAIILRNMVLKPNKSHDKDYFSADGVTPEGQRAYMYPLVLKFVNWLSSKEKTEKGEGDTDVNCF